MGENRYFELETEKERERRGGESLLRPRVNVFACTLWLDKVSVGRCRLLLLPCLQDVPFKLKQKCFKTINSRFNRFVKCDSYEINSSTGRELILRAALVFDQKIRIKQISLNPNQKQNYLFFEVSSPSSGHSSVSSNSTLWPQTPKTSSNYKPISSNTFVKMFHFLKIREGERSRWSFSDLCTA